jgi:hypothetical protein
VAGFLNNAIDISVPQEVANFSVAGKLLISQREQYCMEIL